MNLVVPSCRTFCKYKILLRTTCSASRSLPKPELLLQRLMAVLTVCRNEAAILAARKDKDIVERAELLEALKRVKTITSHLDVTPRGVKILPALV